ncbi:alpha/beta hydrolase-fold protein [Listeria aquatica]|uniref:alpha/beta hydrolase-fold protein n=1 Tax=Listeria aquatica TaxID=1494960 RepID=UPI003F6F1A36
MTVRLQGKYIKNNSNTLVVIFQGVFTKTNEAYADKVVRGEISEQTVKNLHGYYHFMKVSERNPTRDYFYLEDYYSNLYGWYLFDHERFIYEELSSQLSQFIQKHHYKHVYLVGSSKGGVGAIILALHCPEVEKVFTMVPDLKISTDTFGASGRSLFFNNDPVFEKQVKTIFENKALFNELDKRDETPAFFFFTGVRDYGFKAITSFHRKLQEEYQVESHILVMPTPEPHSPLIKNHPNLMNHLIQNLDKELPWEEDEFTSVSSFSHIATYKAIGMK